MKKLLTLAFVPAFLAVTAFAAAPAPVLKTQQDKVSYTIGYQLGKNLSAQQVISKRKFVYH